VSDYDMALLRIERLEAENRRLEEEVADMLAEIRRLRDENLRWRAVLDHD